MLDRYFDVWYTCLIFAIEECGSLESLYGTVNS